MRAFAALVAGSLVVAACGKPHRPYATDVPAGNPVGVAVTPDGSIYFGGHAPVVGLRKVTEDGRVGIYVGSRPASGSPVPTGPGFISSDDTPNPIAITSTADGTIYVVDQVTQEVVKITPDRKLTVLLDPNTSPVVQPRSVAVTKDGTVLVTEPSGHRVIRVGSGGQVSTFAGNGTDVDSGDGGPAAQAGINFPTGIATDGAGNVYVAEGAGRRVRRIDTSGTITTIAGTGVQGSGGDGGPAINAQFVNPVALAIDSAGNIYVVDRDGQKVRKIDASGAISTIAGTGEVGFDGDRGPGPAAKLCFPEGVATDAKGQVFIADTYSNRIRRVATDGTIATVVGSPSPPGEPDCEPPG
jgi:sugar lactone lactonase YvrE